jgi:hypothetical protein
LNVVADPGERAAPYPVPPEAWAGPVEAALTGATTCPQFGHVTSDVLSSRPQDEQFTMVPSRQLGL